MQEEFSDSDSTSNDRKRNRNRRKRFKKASTSNESRPVVSKFKERKNQFKNDSTKPSTKGFEKGNNKSPAKDQEYSIEISAIGIKDDKIRKMYGRAKEVKRLGNKYRIVYKSENDYKIDIKKDEKFSSVTNKIIGFNFCYKETEESIRDVFSKFGKISNIKLEHTKEGVFSGKAIITFTSFVTINEDVVMNGKAIRIERVKDKNINDKRFFVTNISKNLTIVKIRSILKKAGCKPLDIRIRYGTDGRNIGYCHITYSNREGARNFERAFGDMQNELGENSQYEYAIDN